MSVTNAQFSLAALATIDKPQSVNNVQSLVVWAASEGSDATWNIWDTEESGEPGETNYNSVGVKDYPSMDEGLDAFKRTILNGYYQNILDCLTDSVSPSITCAAIVNSPWGSKPTPGIVASVLQDWNSYANHVVAGSDQSSVPSPPVNPAPNAPTVPFDPQPGGNDVQVPVLKQGDNEAAVKAVQSILNGEAGARLTIDGDFGPATEQAVKAWQTFWHLTVDGIVGPITWGTLVGI